MERSVHTCIHDLMRQALPLAERLLIERIHPSAGKFRNRLYDGVRRMFRLELGKYRVALRRTHWLDTEMKRFGMEALGSSLVWSYQAHFNSITT